MALHLRKASERGAENLDWLDTRYSFSFSNYYDPAHMGFRALRVINEDRVAPGAGFPTHGHRDMEIVTYVLSGAIAHKDSMGHEEVLRAGEVQRMSAGTGVRHSEYNASDKELLHLYQIWILPEREGIAPGYEQKEFPASEKRGRLKLLAARDGREGSLTLHQDAALYATILSKGEALEHPLAPGRHAWVQVARGTLEVTAGKDSQVLKAGDGLAVSGESALRLLARDNAEALLFDLA